MLIYSTLSQSVTRQKKEKDTPTDSLTKEEQLVVVSNIQMPNRTFQWRGVTRVCLPELRLSRSARLPPAPPGAPGRSSVSGRWRSAPGPAQEPPPGTTEPRAGPSAEPGTETGNGPASPWGSTDPRPEKRRVGCMKRERELWTRVFLFILCIHSKLSSQFCSHFTGLQPEWRSLYSTAVSENDKVEFPFQLKISRQK